MIQATGLIFASKAMPYPGGVSFMCFPPRIENIVVPRKTFQAGLIFDDNTRSLPLCGAP